MSAVAAAIAGSALLTYSASSKATDAASDAAGKQGQVADAQTQLGREQLDLARQQYADGQARQSKFDPLYEQMMQSALSDSTTARDRSGAQWQQYIDKFQPLENQLATTATNYDTPGRRAQEAADARAGVQTQFDAAQAQQQRGLSRAGISLDSGRALTLGQNADFAKAKAIAGADRAAVKQVEDRGIQLVDNAARFGRNQTSTALTASGQGTGATQAASGIGATGQSVNNSAIAPALQMFGGAASSLGSAGSLWGANANTNSNLGAGLNSAIGGIGQAAGYYFKNNPIGGTPGLSSGMAANPPAGTIDYNSLGYMP